MKKDKTSKRKPQASEIETVDLIDRIPTEGIDTTKLAEYIDHQLQNIETDRNIWATRRRDYIQDIDNFISFERNQLPFENASHLHIPITLEKLRATHARFFQALFALTDSFFVEPQTRMDVKRLYRIRQLMRWALSRFVNNYKGIQSVMEEWIWNICAEGWGFLRLYWDTKVRKALVVEQDTPTLDDIKNAKDDELPVKFKEVFKWLTVFEGPVVENIQPEDVYFGGQGNIKTLPLVGIKTIITASDLHLLKARKMFEAAAVDIALTHPDTIDTYPSGATDTIKNQKGYNQGVEIHNAHHKHETFDFQPSTFQVFECYTTFDIDNDGIDEEVVAWYHRSSKQILRWTYLDRITRTGRRPIYKADYIIRPGRPYAIGLCELLHSLSVEVDAIHNQRVDYGTIANMPFFFYDANSMLPNENIMIAPGKGIPMTDPKENVFFPTLSNRTAFGYQEEQLLFQIIGKVSSISDLNSGMPVSPAEMTRTQGGVAALLAEGNAQLDVVLRRIQETYAELLGDIYEMLVERLPRDFEYQVVGDDGNVQTDEETGEAQLDVLTNPREEISGKVHFFIRANSAAGNKAMMRNSRTQLFQQLLNPLNLQYGVVGPEQLYEMSKALLEVSDEIDYNRFIQKPQNADKPLPLQEELNQIRQGITPTIPLNDDHQGKADAIKAFANSGDFLAGLHLGTITPNAVIAAATAIEQHLKFAKMMDQMRQQYQNNTGSQVPQGVGNPQNGVNPQQAFGLTQFGGPQGAALKQTGLPGPGNIGRPPSTPQ